MKTKNQQGKRALLDRSGTSQNSSWKRMSYGFDLPTEDSLPDSVSRLVDIAKQKRCVNDAPMICIPPTEGKAGKLFQGTCNSWNCPRCGLMRASHEYARICEGIKKLILAGFKLYFLTITVKGNVSTAEAEKTYLDCTNRLFTVLRSDAKRTRQYWTYVQVTERQRRGHPHSHMITTYCPHDAFYILDDYKRYVKEVARLNRWLPEEMRFSPEKPNKIKDSEMFSRWLCMKCVNAGLGVQCSVSAVRSATGAAIYMAKYMFKSAQDAKWPKGWKRIRYSQNWEKMPEGEETEAFVVLKREDWLRVKGFKQIETDDPFAYEMALLRGVYHIKCTVPNHIDVTPD